MPFSGVEVTLNSNTYNDSSFLSNGHQTAFLSALSDFLTEAGSTTSAASTSATAAANSATAAASSAADAAAVSVNALNTTSTTSLAIGTGSKSWTLADDKPFVYGMNMKAVNPSDYDEWMFGTVTSYDSGTQVLTVNVTRTSGTGTIASWNVFSTSVDGEDGAFSISGLTAIDQEDLQGTDQVAIYDSSASNNKKITVSDLDDRIYLASMV